ncbi:MAG TPA: phage/plasmid primase, P4 family [Bryobacteraceae bacterium]
MADEQDQLDRQESRGEIQRVEPAQGLVPSLVENVRGEFQDLSLNYDCRATGLGNAECMVLRHKSRLRYVTEKGEWLFWQGFWVVDVGDVHVRQLAKDTIKSRYWELSQIKEEKARTFMYAWLLRSESDEKLSEMLKLASTDSNLAVHVSELDAHPHLLLCGNGVVDLRTGILTENRPELLLTKRTDVPFIQDAKSEVWESFLEQVTGGDSGLRRFLQLATGYSATGFIREEVLFMVHGPGGRGKSTFIDAIGRALGDYYVTSNFTTFLMRDRVSSGPSEDIARLAGARLVTAIEVEEGQKLAEALVKSLTGGDMIAARLLYKGTFEYRPQFTLWLICNHMPTFSNMDEAMGRRILRLPFEQKPTVVNKNLKALLTDAVTSPAILAWIVRGAIDWFENGLQVPNSVRIATDQAREQMDPLADFIEEECTLDPTALIPAVRLRARYEIWCKNSGQRYTLGRRKFDRQLEWRGLMRDHRYVNGVKTWCWLGIREGASDSAPGRMPERFTERGGGHE